MAYRKFYSKNNFLGGEAGPLEEGRSDLPQYPLACAKIRNFIPLKGGGVTRRPGTRYVDNTGKTGVGNLRNYQARLFPFIVGTSESYIVEATSDDATLTQYKLIENINTPAESTYASTIAGTGLLTTSQLASSQYASIGRFLFITNPDVPITILNCTDRTTLTIKGIDDSVVTLTNSATWLRIPYKDANATAVTMTLSAATVGTGRTMTSSAAYFSNSTALDVGTRYRFLDGYVIVTAKISTTQVTVTVESAASSAAATTNWAEAAWSHRSGFPRAVGVYNQRLMFGGTATQPDTFWGSETNDYLQFAPTTYSADVIPSDPIQYTLASDQFNAIQWIIGGKKLIIGTTSTEWVGSIEVSTDGTANVVTMLPETAHGSAHLQAKRVSYSANFIQRGQKLVREMAFNFNSDSYVATDLNVFASHVANDTPDDGMLQIDYQESPFQCLWTVTDNGKAYALTRDRQQNIAAWSSHEFGGSYDDRLNGLLPGSIAESVAVVPSPDGSFDRVYFSVLRTVNSNDVRFVEWMDTIRENVSSIYPGDSYYNNRTFLDASKYFHAVNSTVTVTGMSYLASDTAYAVAFNDTDYDSATLVYAGSVTINGSGNITLPHKANHVFVGLNPTAYLRSLPSDGDANPTVYPGAIRRIDQLSVRIHDTFGLKVGKSRTFSANGDATDNLDVEQIPFSISTPLETIDGSIANGGLASFQSTFRGTKTINPPIDYDSDGGYILMMEEPWPCTVLGITARMVVNEV
jgi:hypothetical protein